MTREEAARMNTMPNEVKPCPCNTCQLRQYFAHAFDMHFCGEDCPYQCDMYDEYNCRAGEEDKHD